MSRYSCGHQVEKIPPYMGEQQEEECPLTLVVSGKENAEKGNFYCYWLIVKAILTLATSITWEFTIPTNVVRAFMLISNITHALTLMRLHQ